MGVADGVWAWREQGIDAGEYSAGLLEAARDGVEAAGTEEAAAALDVSALLADAHAAVTARGLQGSATMCLLLLESATGMLRSANIGDSGFAVLRRDDDEEHDTHVVYRSAQQEHDFGRPYQLGHHAHSDTAADAMLADVRLRPNDVIVAGTDGVFDNVSLERMADCVGAALGAEEAAAAAGQPSARQGDGVCDVVLRGVLETAFANSVSQKADTPYSMAASEWHNMIYSGGKMDDISIVVARVVERDHAPAAAAGAPVFSGAYDRGHSLALV